MTITINPDELLKVLGTEGEHWTKGTYGDGDNVCLHGAIRRCQPHPGDAHIIEQVAIRKGWGPSWNDDNDTKWTDVKALVLAGVEITDADLADTFGPQWEAIVALVRRTAVLTVDEAQQRDAAGALVVRDLIGQHGFTQEHYDTLTGPWRKVIGPVHPDDAVLS